MLTVWETETVPLRKNKQDRKQVRETSWAAEKQTFKLHAVEKLLSHGCHGELCLSLCAHLLEHCKCSECSTLSRKHLSYAGTVSVVPLGSINTDWLTALRCCSHAPVSIGEKKQGSLFITLFFQDGELWRLSASLCAVENKFEHNQVLF